MGQSLVLTHHVKKFLIKRVVFVCLCLSSKSSMSEISEPGIMVVNYETKLLAALKGFQENYQDLADFTIIARNHEEYKSHKLLLAVRSKYFEALFRTEPEKKSVKLDFDGQILEIILKSL